MIHALKCAVLAGLSIVGTHLQLSAQEVGIEEVLVFTFGRERFVSLREHFGGTEMDGRREVMRTHPDVRAGDYFVIKLTGDVKHLPEGASIEIQLITSRKADPDTYSFPIEKNSPDASEIYVGLTGENTMKPDHALLAWQVHLVSREGDILSEFESFLWEMPGEEAPVSQPGQ